MQQIVKPMSASNGYARRKPEKDVANRLENDFQTEKINFGKIGIGKGGVIESPSRDRLAYMTANLIGQQVEIQMLDGSVYAGILHAVNAEDYGIVLKMAYLVKDASHVPKNNVDISRKPMAKTLIISSGDLVQVIAKGVSVTWEGPVNELLHEKQQELMTDSCISQTRHSDVGRELERWVPDENDHSLPELENTFDCSWNRGWDQFEANKILFGVKSTFDEELYTTKLEKGPQTLELERAAERLAREIEGEDTRDLHLAEERGLQINGSLDIDEETLYSSVYRGVDDSGFDESEDIVLNAKNNETFGALDEAHHVPVNDRHLLDGNIFHNVDATRNTFRSALPVEVVKPFRKELDEEAFCLGSDSSSKEMQSEQPLKQSSLEFISRRVHADPIVELSSKDDKQKHSVDQSLVPKAGEHVPSNSSSLSQDKRNASSEVLESSAPSRTQGTASPSGRPSSSASSTSDCAGVASTSAGQGLSKSSSISSLSSEKSTLNPHAKEFKLNPNAKSFVPSRSPLRPPAPAADSAFYYSQNVAANPQIHGLPVGIGMGPSYAIQQPVLFNSQTGALPQPYYGPQFGPQMMVGQQRPVIYMQQYPPEMPPYKGREF